MAESERTPPIRFRGAPGELAAVVTDAGVVRIRLPRHTPPGRHETDLNVGDKTYAAVLEVEENIELELFPDLLRLTGGAGEVIARELTIVNHGNVPIDVPRAGGFGLFEHQGLERAIGEALMDRKQDGASTIDTIARGAGESHAGLMRIRVEEGAGTLAPTESRDLRVSFHLPDGIRPARVYTGLWELYTINYYVEVRGTNKKGAQP
jgi:hypothetical protein